MSTSPFVLGVSDLLAGPGSHRDVQVQAQLAAGGEAVHTVATEPIVADLRLESLPDGIYITGVVASVARFTCNRCLTEWDETRTDAVAQLVRLEPDENGYAIVEGAVDVEGLITDEIALAYPLVPLCDEACKGLCPTCGTDLNDAPCDGHEEDTVSPFAALRDLLGE